MAKHQMADLLAAQIDDGNLPNKLFFDEKTARYALSIGRGVPTHTDALVYIDLDGATEDVVLYLRDVTAGDWTAVVAP